MLDIATFFCIVVCHVICKVIYYAISKISILDLIGTALVRF